MTQPIQEPSNDRALQGMAWARDQIFRRPAPTASGGPILFRAAMRAVDDPETNRIHYGSGDGGDNVYWDYWDLTFDTTVFDTGPYEFVDPLTGRDMIAGVGLLLPGLYSIFAEIDLGQYLNGVTQMQSNYDDGQATYAEVNNAEFVDATFLGDYMGARLDHWRELPVGFDVWNAESNVEIVFSQNNNSDITFYGTNGTGPGTYPFSGGTPGVVTPDSDVWIPGGYDGAWGTVPHMIVAYWGSPQSEGFDPDWPDPALLNNPGDWPGT